jgi:hypothetical protein
VQGLEQVAGSSGANQRVLRQVNAERTLDTQHQFHPRQAVETEIAIQRVVQSDGPILSGVPVKFNEQGAHNVEKLGRRVGTRPCFSLPLRCLHCLSPDEWNLRRFKLAGGSSNSQASDM